MNVPVYVLAYFRTVLRLFPGVDITRFLRMRAGYHRRKENASRLLDPSSSPKQLRGLKPCNYAVLHVVFICHKEIRQFPVRKQGDQIRWVPKAVLWSQDLSFYDPEVLAKDQVLARVYRGKEE